MNAGVDVEPALAQPIVRRLNDRICAAVDALRFASVEVVGSMLSELMAARFPRG